jgi:hypothetical protein
LIRKTKITFAIFAILLSILVVQILYLVSTKSLTKQQIEIKYNFVKISQMPDLALCTDTFYIRHRTLSDMFSIYKDEAGLREYSLTTFAYSRVVW